MKAQYKFIYARKKAFDTDGKAFIQLQVYFDRNHRKLINTKVKILPKHWDPVKHHIRPVDKELAEKYEMLQNIIRDLEGYEMELIRKNEKLTPARVDEFFIHGRSGSFNTFMEQELKASVNLKYGTTKGHWVCLRKLNEFQPIITFADISFDLVNRFDQYLHSLGLGTNTIADHHKVIRRYIQIAIKKELVQPSQHPYHGKFKVKREATARAYLTDDEILAIEKIDYSGSNKLAKIKEMFLFSIYSGLRFSDLMNLKPEHIQKTREGYEIALHKMVKIPQPVFIPLHMVFEGKGEPIIKKAISDKTEYIFPRITGQKANEYLKTVALDAKIHKRVTWHTARHTFGSQLAARYNDPYLIMQLMGHQEIKTSMIYIHSSQEIIKQKLKKVKW